MQARNMQLLDRGTSPSSLNSNSFEEANTTEEKLRRPIGPANTLREKGAFHSSGCLIHEVWSLLLQQLKNCTWR